MPCAEGRSAKPSAMGCQEGIMRFPRYRHTVIRDIYHDLTVSLSAKVAGEKGDRRTESL